MAHVTLTQHQVAVKTSASIKPQLLGLHSLKGGSPSISAKQNGGCVMQTLH